MADINGLKAINDGQGHAAGDAFLRQAAHPLTEVAGPHSRVCRFGGDKFIVVAGHGAGSVGRGRTVSIRSRSSDLATVRSVPLSRLG